MQSKDNIYRKPLNEVKDFIFDGQVAAVFDDMIDRSVPLYRLVQEVSALLTARFIQPHSSFYDLGCSTGTSIAAAAHRIAVPGVSIIGIDSSAAMLEECRKKLQAEQVEASLICSDILGADIENASVVVLNYTLQFIQPDLRPALLARIFRSLKPGGLLLISEKIKHEQTAVEETLRELHYEFKRERGYSELEIAQKREALENVLVPLSLAGNIALLKAAGFRDVEVVLKLYNFATLAAVKDIT